MGLFNSLLTSTSGMMASSQATNNISRNIANSTTVGYRRSDTAFYDIVSSSLYSSAQTNRAGGVGTSQVLRANQQGQIQQTRSTTDASISGNGFFVVKEDINADTPFRYTRNGQFDEYAIRATEDANPLVTERSGEQTFLRNSAGYILYAWPLDQDGNVASGSDLTSLVPAEVGLFESANLPTTEVVFSANLDADEVDYNPHTFSPAQSLPVSDAVPANFSRSINVYDPLGNEYPLELEFRKITGPVAQASSGLLQNLTFEDTIVDPLGKTRDILAGDTLSLSNGTETLDITFVNAPADPALNEASTIQEAMNLINNFTGLSDPATTQFDAKLDNDGQLLIQSVDPAAQLDLSGSSASVLGENGFRFVPDPADGDYVYAPAYDITAAAAADGAYPNQGAFPDFANTTNPSTHGWWEVSVLIPDSTDPTGEAQTVVSQGLLSFNGDGTINATPDENGEITIDLSTIPIDFDPATTGDETALRINMTRISQFAGNYDVIDAEQNGAGVGLRTGVSINRNGIVTAEFANGIKSDIYQIPLAIFANASGLLEQDGATFEESINSGTASLAAADSNGAGIINGSSIENSNVDITDEFGYLIVHQRSFGLNSQVINAVDEMTQNLAQLKR